MELFLTPEELEQYQETVGEDINLSYNDHDRSKLQYLANYYTLYVSIRSLTNCTVKYNFKNQTTIDFMQAFNAVGTPVEDQWYPVDGLVDDVQWCVHTIGGNGSGPSSASTLLIIKTTEPTATALRHFHVGGLATERAVDSGYYKADNGDILLSLKYLKDKGQITKYEKLSSNKYLLTSAEITASTSLTSTFLPGTDVNTVKFLLTSIPSTISCSKLSRQFNTFLLSGSSFLV